MQIQTTIIHHLTLVRIAIIQSQKITGTGEVAEKGNTYTHIFEGTAILVYVQNYACTSLPIIA